MDDAGEAQIWWCKVLVVGWGVRRGGGGGMKGIPILYVAGTGMADDGRLMRMMLIGEGLRWWSISGGLRW
ncbi:hypothetical protein HanPSC8_Chr08g0318801 [Helianthus annuus]|nr:hypothetical protein HanPSC8_Chr08g0318801 [Helianthus annuus]